MFDFDAVDPASPFRWRNAMHRWSLHAHNTRTQSSDGLFLLQISTNHNNLPHILLIHIREFQFLFYYDVAWENVRPTFKFVATDVRRLLC